MKTNVVLSVLAVAVQLIGCGSDTTVQRDPSNAVEEGGALPGTGKEDGAGGVAVKKAEGTYCVEAMTRILGLCSMPIPADLALGCENAPPPVQTLDCYMTAEGCDPDFLEYCIAGGQSAPPPAQPAPAPAPDERQPDPGSTSGSGTLGTSGTGTGGTATGTDPDGEKDETKG